MYPDRELTRLAAHKARLRRAIARHRAECVAAGSRLARPVEWLDRLLGLWRRFAPLAAVPLGFLVQRTVFPRRKLLGSLLRWGPLVFNAVRGISSAVKSRRAAAPAPAPLG